MPLRAAVGEVRVGGEAVEAVWAGTEARTRIAFGPVEMRHGQR